MKPNFVEAPTDEIILYEKRENQFVFAGRLDKLKGLVVGRVNEIRPDFVWISLGAPKQECWMAEHQGKIKGFMVGVGAGFDYFAGNISWAPMWIQKTNLEWMCRLLQDPRGLLSRYWHTNTKFIWSAVVRGK